MKNYRTINLSALIIKIFFTFLLTITAVVISISISSAYYKLAAFHWDSGGYLAKALYVSDIIHQFGRIHALSFALSDKDSLDITLRILFFPHYLKTTFGHMTIVTPFMALFIFLIIHYVYQRTKSWLTSVAVASLLFIFPMMYFYYMGIADYWKESIAVWILGSAILSWLLGNMLSRIGWSFLCGLLLGLLAMERTALFIYFAVLFFPIVVFACYERFKNDNLNLAFKRISVFILPTATLCCLVLLLQYKLLYTYYFVTGYAYGQTTSQLIDFLLFYILTFFKFPLLIVSILFLISCLNISYWKQQYKDILIAIWFTLGFVMLLIFTKTLYQNFWIILGALLTVLITTVVPIHRGRYIKSGLFGLIFLVIGVTASIYQYLAYKSLTMQSAKKDAKVKTFYTDLVNVIMQQKEPRYASFLFAEIGSEFSDYMRLDRNIPLDQIKFIGSMTVHDSYYPKDIHDENSLRQFVKQNTQTLEKYNGTLVVTYCQPIEAKTSPGFGDDGKKIAIPFVEKQTNYLLKNKNWKVISTIPDSYYGCLNVFQYSKGKS